MTDAAPLRAHWSLEPGRVFLNHGSYGACPTVVLDYQQELQRQLERAPSNFMERLPQLLESPRQQLAQFLGGRPDDLAWVSNATSGVNAVLRSLDFQEGDAILVTDHVYAACYNVVSYLAESRGVTVVEVPVAFPALSCADIVAAILEAVTPSTRLALLDHVSSPTAMIFPIAEVASALRDRGVKVLVDGAHAAGMLPLDLESLEASGVTYYAGNLHKWCCAPKGAGFLWVTASDQKGVHPPVISHGFRSPSPRSKFLEEFDWCGTFDPTAWLAAPRSLQYLQDLAEGGWPELRRSCHDLLLEGRQLVSEVLPKQPLVPTGMLGQMASLVLPAGDAVGLYRRLYDEYGIDSWIAPWNGRRILRLSAAPYNTISDYHALAAALRGIASQESWL